MSFTIRPLEAVCNDNDNDNDTRSLCTDTRLEALRKAIPFASIERALEDTQVTTLRERKLNHTVTMLLVIAMNLFADDNIGYVLERLCKGKCLLRSGNADSFASALKALPGDSALVYRRYQLGPRPLAALFHHLCRPLAASEQTCPSAFLFGLRLMGIDGQLVDVLDTPENTAYFGRSSGRRGDSAFAKVQALYLCELGTHAIIDAGFWPSWVSEKAVASRLLRSVTDGMLVMWDRGLWAYHRIKAARRKGAHVLCRMHAGVKPVPEKPLSDGSSLVWIAPGNTRNIRTSQRRSRNKDGKDGCERMLVRLIEYTIDDPDDPDMPGSGEKYQIITTLLDPDQYPARDLAVAYHERWEVEVTLDEMEVHQLRQQHLHDGPLRSRKPLGVLQELYGLLIAHWAIRSVMYDAAQRADLAPDRISFVRALRVIQTAVRDFQIADLESPESFDVLYAQMLVDIALHPLPERRARSNPRAVRRQVSPFAVKKPEIHKCRRFTKSFQEAIVLI